MNFSYWEHKSWLSHIDFAIVGSGIVGLSCALSLRKKYPKSTIRVFEQGLLPSGASTKNAGFACFGSVSEILDDLKTHSEEEVIQLVRERVKGLQLLRNTLGDELLDYQAHGGYEVFTKNDEELYETCVSEMSRINNLIKDAVFDEKEVFLLKKDPFSFKNVQKQLIFNQFEGQLDTGKMMLGLIQKCAKNDIIILNSAKISSFACKNDEISLILNDFHELRTRKLFIATNGFANRIIEQEVKPARAQVLITKPIKDLHLKGTFHLDRGYYYFRNIDNRVLLGGGRNLDFKGEQTTQLGLTQLIQHKLEELLRTTILPNTAFEIESRWSGIMGVGGQKKPIVKELDANVYCGIRLGGMGVAIGSAVGQQLAQLA
ncbi:MAG: FAD-binding oxidoreductase [Flavobacteriaceae bacterium]|nr:FAD-binding oxidoreductase [Flavobacteriaceae bacterium]